MFMGRVAGMVWWKLVEHQDQIIQLAVLPVALVIDSVLLIPSWCSFLTPPHFLKQVIKNKEQ